MALAENVSVQAKTLPERIVTCAKVSFLGGPETIFDILFHIVILSFILEVVYEVKLKKMEEEGVQDSIKSILKSSLGSMLDKNQISLPPQLFDAIKVWFKNDEQHDTINKMVVGRNRLLIGMLTFACAGFFVTVAGSCHASNSMHALKNVLKNNACLLLLVGAIEGVFVFKVILKWVPAKPSFMAETVMDRLKHVGIPDPPCKSMTESCNGNLPKSVIIGGYSITTLMLLALTRFYKPSTHRFSFSQVMWQGCVVSAVISGLFLTLGVTQENLAMTNTVNRIVDSFTVSLHDSIKEISPGSAQTIREHLAAIDSTPTPEMQKVDDEAMAGNKKLEKLTGYIVGTTFALALIVTIVERSVISRKFKAGKTSEKNELLRNVLFAAIIAGCCSFIAEFNFMVNVAAKTRPISVNQVSNDALDIISSKLSQKTPIEDE